MKCTTERKWHGWPNGVVQITCPSMWVGQKRLWWTSGETLPLFIPPSPSPTDPSTALPWRESAALNSWGCTLQRISPGPPTSCHSTRRDNSAYTLSADWKGQVSLHPSSPLSTGAPLRVCWPPASLSGTGTAVLLTTRPYNGQLTLLQRSSVALSPPSWLFSLHDARAKPTASWRTPPTPPTNFFSSCHQVEGTGVSKLALSDCSTAFPPGFESYYLQTPCSPLKPWTPQAPPLPATKTQRLNKIMFTCALHYKIILHYALLSTKSFLHNDLMCKIYIFAQFHVQISLLHNFMNMYIHIQLCKVFVQSQFV